MRYLLYIEPIRYLKLNSPALNILGEIRIFVSSSAVDNVTRLSRPILAIGFFIGLILSLSALSGDDSGRVNLLYLLLVFLLLPLLGAVISVLSLFGNKGINLARLASLLPIWSQTQKNTLRKIRQSHMDKPWLFLQSQAAALAYSAASLFVFMILLLTTDINFVWRSTLLEAEQLLPLLTFLASPWFFWDLAQPSLELLQATQDSRLTQTYSNTESFGQWWAFVLATQLVYSFFLRGMLLVIGKFWLRQLDNKKTEQQLAKSKKNAPLAKEKTSSTEAIGHSLPSNYALNNWAGLSAEKLSQLALQPNQELHINILDNVQHDGQQLLLVKAWEPPMGELQDYMLDGQGLLFPINTVGGKLTPPEKKHLQEWLRFVSQIPNWSIYLPSHWKVEHD